MNDTYIFISAVGHPQSSVYILVGQKQLDAFSLKDTMICVHVLLNAYLTAHL